MVSHGFPFSVHSTHPLALSGLHFHVFSAVFNMTSMQTELNGAKSALKTNSKMYEIQIPDNGSTVRVTVVLYENCNDKSCKLRLKGEFAGLKMDSLFLFWKSIFESASRKMAHQFIF